MSFTNAVWPAVLVLYTWSVSVPSGVVGHCTICVKLKLDMRLKMAEFQLCDMSSLKSPSTTHSRVLIVKCVNILVSKVTRVA